MAFRTRLVNVRQKRPKIVSLHGHAIRQPGVPHPDVIEPAEKVLERAKSGEIKGVIAVVFHADDSTSAFSGGAVSYGVLGRLVSETQQLAEFLGKAQNG